MHMHANNKLANGEYVHHSIKFCDMIIEQIKVEYVYNFLTSTLDIYSALSQTTSLSCHFLNNQQLMLNLARIVFQSCEKQLLTFEKKPLHSLQMRL